MDVMRKIAVAGGMSVRISFGTPSKAVTKAIELRISPGELDLRSPDLLARMPGFRVIMSSAGRGDA